MIFHIFTKEGWVGKCEFVADLLDAEICLPQVVTDILQHLFCNPFVGGLARILLADSSKVLGRDAQLAGISFYRVTFHIVRVQQVEEVLEVDLGGLLFFAKQSGIIVQMFF